MVIDDVPGQPVPDRKGIIRSGDGATKALGIGEGKIEPRKDAPPLVQRRIEPRFQMRLCHCAGPVITHRRTVRTMLGNEDRIFRRLGRRWL